MRPGAATVSVTRSGVATKDAGHGLGVGTARRAAAIEGAPRGSGAAVPVATGRLSATGASSGTHVFSQTSQLACPRRVTRAPGARSDGAVIGIGKTISFE